MPLVFALISTALSQAQKNNPDSNTSILSNVANLIKSGSKTTEEKNK